MNAFQVFEGGSTWGWAARGVMGILLAVPLSGSAQQRGEILLHEQFDVESGGALVVEVPDADIVLETGGSGVEIEVHVDASDQEWGREVFERMDFQASARGSTVRLEADNPRIRWSRGRNLHIVAVIRIPEQFDVEVATQDGNIDADRLDGRVSLVTQDGDITVAEVRGGDLQVLTQDGDITLNRIDVSQAQVQTQDGDIRLDDATGELQAGTQDGDIDVRLNEASPVSLRSGDGDIRVWLPVDIQADVDLEGEDLEFNEFTIQGRLRRNSIEGTLNGGGPLLQVRTGDGSVTLVSATVGSAPRRTRPQRIRRRR